MDTGDIDKACDEKSRLEQKQRDVAKKREVDYVPKWFKLLDHPTLKEPAWTYTNKYFERKFDKCERIFDDESVWLFVLSQKLFVDFYWACFYHQFGGYEISKILNWNNLCTKNMTK